MRVNGQSVKKPWQMIAEEVTQIWAEAVAVYKGGEKLFLEGNVDVYKRQGNGYRAVEAWPVAMFGGTGHVETAVLLVRKA